MSRLLSLFGLAVVATTLLTTATTLTSAKSFDKYDMLCQVNKERKKQGLYALTLNNDLCNSALKQSDYMAQKRVMSHNGHGGSSPAQRIAKAGIADWTSTCENVAFGYNSNAAVMKAWMKSPGHRANIMTNECTMFGFAYATDKSGTVYFTQDFAGTGGKKKTYPTCPGRGDSSGGGYGSSGGYGSGNSDEYSDEYTNDDYGSGGYGGGNDDDDDMVGSTVHWTYWVTKNGVTTYYS